MEVIKMWVEQLGTLFDEIDRKIDEFRNLCGIKCPPFCSSCCEKGNIEATVLEFVPAVWHLFQSREQDFWIERLMSLEEGDPCVFLTPGAGKQGGCCIYPHRGLICRLYGFSYYNRKDDAELIACAIIKSMHPSWVRIKSKDANFWRLPLAGNYGIELSIIAPDIGKTLYPINTAIRKGFELVGLYFTYYSEFQKAS